MTFRTRSAPPGRGRTPAAVAALAAVAEEALRQGAMSTSVSERELQTFLRRSGRPCPPLLARQVREVLLARELVVDAAEPGPGAGTLGSRLRTARVEARLTRDRLASATHCTSSYLSYLESDKRIPSDELLGRIAGAVGRDVDWLRTGEDSDVTRRIQELLRSGEAAWNSGDQDEVVRCIALLRGDPGRPLRVDEADLTAYLEAQILLTQGRLTEAYEVVDPLMRRALDGRAKVPVLRLGICFARVVGHLPGASRSLQHAGWQSVLQLLETAQREAQEQGAERPDDWWRLAATSMLLSSRLFGVRACQVQAEAWLDEFDAASPSGRVGVAALSWNIGVYDLAIGRIEQGFENLSRAVEWYDWQEYPRDGARIRPPYAYALMSARPHRVQEAIDILEDVAARLERHGFHEDLKDWTFTRGLAEHIAGRPAECARYLEPLLVDATVPVEIRCEARLVRGDALAAQGLIEPARSDYAAAEELLRAGRLADHVSPEQVAQYWQGLALRRHRLGDAGGAMEEYAQALAALGLRPGLVGPHVPTEASATGSDDG